METQTPVISIGVGGSDVGRTRQVNQDSFYTSDREQLYIVADGMGGHAGGEIASSMCVTAVARTLREKNLPGLSHAQHPDANISALIAQAINSASTKIYERALEEQHLKGMGTTATVLQIIGNHAYVGHVGDSRCYLLREGLIYQVTNDHSLVSEQVRAGIITKEEAETHYLKNVITRSVGYQEEEEVDTTCLTLSPGDFLLLCSDGLHGKMSDQEIANLVLEKKDQAVQPLINLANERGGEDNISVVIVKINSAS